MVNYIRDFTRMEARHHILVLHLKGLKDKKGSRVCVQSNFYNNLPSHLN